MFYWQPFNTRLSKACRRSTLIEPSSRDMRVGVDQSIAETFQRDLHLLLGVPIQE